MPETADPMSIRGTECSMRNRLAMYNDNVLKIGLFGMNCSSGRSATMVPERWSASWPDCLRAAQMADAAGLDFILPIGRWKGYGGETDFHGATLETVTWAASLLALTKRITIFGTVHAPLFHPIVAAKEFVTADQVGEGRFGLNVVCGWNAGEFEMFGVAQRDHETRYAHAREWLDIVKVAWEKQEDFDFDGEFFRLRKVRAFPKPFGGTRPLIMNAGASEVGRAFALRHCDAFFTSTATSRLSLGDTAAHVHSVKEAARAFGREIDVYSMGQVVCRPTRGEAEAYYRHAMLEHADWGAVEGVMALRGFTRETLSEDAFEAQRVYQASRGIGGYPFVGTPDDIAAELAALSGAGIRGVALSFVNFVDELPLFRDEVLPRLVDRGVRTNG